MELKVILRDENGRFIKGIQPKTGFKKGNIPWNKDIPRTEETKRKISLSHMGKYTGKDNPFFGKHHSIKIKKLLSEIHKGKHLSSGTEFKKNMIPWNINIPHNQETKDKISKANKGKIKGIPFSEQHKINLSKSLKGRVPGFLGKHWTKENKENFSKLQIKRYQNPEYRKKISGENSPMWRGGISKLPYSFDFDKELKELIRKRDNYKCQLCGMSELENIKKLCIHHIDYKKKNCSPDNLISLCGNCNPKVNFNRDYWTKYFQDKMEEKE